jgi:thiol-disulfide isomerase/thioredoxin
MYPQPRLKNRSANKGLSSQCLEFMSHNLSSHRARHPPSSPTEAFQGQAAVATLDVEAEPETPKRYGIQTLPAALFFKDGEVVDQLSGVVDKVDIAAKLHALTESSQA